MKGLIKQIDVLERAAQRMELVRLKLWLYENLDNLVPWVDLERHIDERLEELA